MNTPDLHSLPEALQPMAETYESLQPFIRKVKIDGVTIPTLDVDGLLKTKTGHREKDAIDRQFLLKIKKP